MHPPGRVQRRQFVDHDLGLLRGDPDHLVADVVARREVLHHDDEAAVVAQVRQVTRGVRTGLCGADVVEERDLAPVDPQRERDLEVRGFGARELDDHTVGSAPRRIAQLETGDLAEDARALTDVGDGDRSR